MPRQLRNYLAAVQALLINLDIRRDGQSTAAWQVRLVLIGVCLALAACGGEPTTTQGPGPIVLVPRQRASDEATPIFVVNRVDATDDSGLTIFFPLQPPVEGERVNMTALAVGELMLVDGCLRVGPGGNFLVWPPGFSLSTETDGVQVLDDADQVVARVGEIVRIGGGEGPIIEGAARARLKIPAGCPARPWIVGEVVTGPPKGNPYIISTE